ncbi:MAG: hypothetical protein ABH823_03800 [bacterium]
MVVPTRASTGLSSGPTMRSAAAPSAVAADRAAVAMGLELIRSTSVKIINSINGLETILDGLGEGAGEGLFDAAEDLEEVNYDVALLGDLTAAAADLDKESPTLEQVQHLQASLSLFRESLVGDEDEDEDALGETLCGFLDETYDPIIDDAAALLEALTPKGK